MTWRNFPYLQKQQQCSCHFLVFIGSCAYWIKHTALAELIFWLRTWKISWYLFWCIFSILIVLIHLLYYIWIGPSISSVTHSVVGILNTVSSKVFLNIYVPYGSTENCYHANQPTNIYFQQTECVFPTLILLKSFLIL